MRASHLVNLGLMGHHDLRITKQHDGPTMETESIGKGFNNGRVLGFVIGSLGKEDPRTQDIVSGGATKNPRSGRRSGVAATSTIGKNEKRHDWTLSSGNHTNNNGSKTKTQIASVKRAKKGRRT